MWLYWLIIIILKKYKKSVDQYGLKWYSITCPWDKGKTSTKLLRKGVDKEKQFWSNEEAEISKELWK